MKIRRLLPEQDLANIAPLSYEMQYRALWALKLGIPEFSYTPVKSKSGEIANALTDGAFDFLKPTYPETRAWIAKRCYNERGVSANLQIADGFHEYCESKSAYGRIVSFPSLSVGFLDVGVQAKIKYWQDFIFSVDGIATIPLLDPRRSSRLTSTGRRFAFSVMNERIRLAFPDYMDVRLAILQFENVKEGPRAVIEHFDSDVRLFDINELNTMITRTTRLWWSVLQERARAQPYRPTGTGWLF